MAAERRQPSEGSRTFRFKKRAAAPTQKVEPTNDRPTESRKPRTPRPDLRFLSEAELFRHYKSLEKSTSYWRSVRDFLIVRYEPDVTRVVRSYFSSRMPDYSLVGFHDLLQAGMLCVCRYVDRYDSEYGTTFMEYLNSSVNSKLIGHMIDCLRSMQDYPRVIASNRRLMRPLLHALRHELGKEPTIEEIIDRYGESFRPIVSDPLFFTGVYNQAQETGRQEDDYQIEFEDKSDQQPTVTHKMDAMSRILNVIKDDRIRQVVFAYYYVGKNHCMIAESEGISVSTASNLRREGLRIISSNFSEEELNELSRMARRHGS